MRRRHPKTPVVVEVVVAISTTGVPIIVVERTAPHNAAFFGQPCHPKATGSLYNRNL